MWKVALLLCPSAALPTSTSDHGGSLETLVLVLVSRCVEDMKNGLGLEIKVLVLLLVLKKSLDLGLDLGLYEKVSIFSRP